MISYMAELSLLMSHMSCGKSIKEHPAVFRASKHRTILERLRPIEQKMKSQIDKLSQTALNNGAKQTLRARPEQMEFDDDEAESDEEEEGGNQPKKKEKKYVPPKMVAVRYEEEENEKETKAMERAKRRALQSSLVQELRQQYSDAPEEFRVSSDYNY
ncbi:unnamed protein product [Cylicostephanus goldi]|uniref:Uncharacterized protein n=1 Tax=Cylicostephanus goldi TaxID=71465 RepID=A0A3P6TKS1_CYLGO|nr:unnamed protein product [Cylicostephanus goldi]